MHEDEGEGEGEQKTEEEKVEEEDWLGYGNPACISDSVKCLSGRDEGGRLLSLVFSSSSASLCDS